MQIKIRMKYHITLAKQVKILRLYIIKHQRGLESIETFIYCSMDRSENSEVKREQVGYHGKCLSRCLFLQVWFMTEASASSGPSTGWASPELTVSPGSILKCRLSGPNTSAELESAFNRVIHMHTKG